MSVKLIDSDAVPFPELMKEEEHGLKYLMQSIDSYPHQMTGMISASFG